MQRLLVVSLTTVGLFFTSVTTTQAQDDAAKNAENLFNTLDKNEDGSVGPDEVEEKNKRFFDRLVRVGDANEDGKLTKAEFVKAMTANDPTVRVQPDQNRRGSDRNRQQFFERLDKNNDQKLTLDELPEELKPRFKPIFERLNKDAITLEDLNRGSTPQRGNATDRNRSTFQRFDKNNDQKVSLDELPEAFRERMRPVFERLGKDALTFEELSRSMGRTNPAQPRDRRQAAGAFFDRLDADGDGKVSMKEDVDERMLRAINAILRSLNKGEDGTVTKEEYLKAAAERQRPTAGGTFSRPAPAIVRVLDTNNDGKLSQEELSKAAEKFNQLDTNKDGGIDLRELFGTPTNRRPGTRPETDRPRRPETDRPETDRPRRPGTDRPATDAPNAERLKRAIDEIFSRYDKNEDGKLTGDEIPERMQERLKQIDGNNDSAVDKTEFLEVLKNRRSRD